MGLFSSSYKYKAYAGSSALFEELPTTLRDTIRASGITGHSKSQAVTFALLTDMGNRAKKAVKYALKPDGYIRGLPTSDQKNITVDGSILLSEIQTEVGEPLDKIYWTIIGPGDEDFMVSRHIQEVYSDPAYFPWGDDPDNPLWSEERDFVEIPIIDTGTGKYYITENLPIYERTTPLGFVYKIAFAYTDNLGEPAVFEMLQTLDLTSFSTGDWIQSRYYATATPEQTQYWMYLIGSNANPSIESTVREVESKGEFMPVVIMMQDKIWFNEPEDTPLHVTTNKLLKKFAIKGDTVKEDFLEQQAEDDASGDSSKSNAETWDFYIQWAIPIQTRVRGAMEYLFEFFLEMEKTQQYSFEQYQTYLASRLDKRNGYALPQPISELNITEGGETGYNSTHGWSYIYSETFPGRWVDVNAQDLKANKVEIADYERLDHTDLEYGVGAIEMHGSGILFGKAKDPEKEKTEKNGYHDYVVITKQFHDKDTDMWEYTRVIVMGLSMKYTINTSAIELTQKGYRFRDAEMGMFNFDEDGNRTYEFRIPIHLGVMDLIPRMHWEEVISEGMCATAFLVEKIKIKWYQSSFWKWLIVIVAIILIVLSVIFPPLALLGTALAGAALGTSILLVMLFIVYSFVMGVIISLAAGTIGEEFGQEWGTLFIVIATILSMYQGGSWGFDTAGMNGWGTATTLVSTTATYLNMAVQVYSSYSLANLEDDMRDFMKSAKEKFDEIQDAYDALGPVPEGIDPLDLHRALQIGASESANDYYMRTLNANPNQLGYDLINDFAAIAMTLPDLGGKNIIDTQIEMFEQQRGMV